MVAVDLRPETQVRAMADAVWAQSVSRSGATSRRCECSQGSRVGHGSSRSRGWRHQSRSRSSVEACQRTAQVCESRPFSSPGGYIRGTRVRVQKLEAALFAMTDFPGPEVDILQTRQSCRGPTSSECAGDTVPTIFIERTVKRIKELDRVRETESRRLQEGRQWLQRLQQEAVAGAPTVSDRPGHGVRSCLFARSGCPPPGTAGNEGLKRCPSHSGVL